jgi:hypothetical protein
MSLVEPSPSAVVVAALEEAAARHLEAFERGEVAAGRLLYELGAVFQKAGLARSESESVARAAGLHAQWESGARAAVLCWLWAGEQLGLPKVATQAVARMVWTSRHTWSEGPARIGCGCGAATEAARLRFAKAKLVQGAVSAPNTHLNTG